MSRLTHDRLRNHNFVITLIRRGHFGHVHHVLLVCLRESLVAVFIARQVQGLSHVFTGHRSVDLLVAPILRRETKWKLLIFGLDETSLLLLLQTCRSLILCYRNLGSMLGSTSLSFSSNAADNGDEEDNAERDCYPGYPVLIVCWGDCLATHVQRVLNSRDATVSCNAALLRVVFN